MLANMYMNRFLKHWRRTGTGGAFRGRVISYADDFVILSRGKRRRHWSGRGRWWHGWGSRSTRRRPRSGSPARELRLPGIYVRTTSISEEWSLVFGGEPIEEKRPAAQGKVGEILVPSNQAPWMEVRDRLNGLLRGWCAYFGYGTRLIAYRAVDNHVYTAYGISWRRHKVQSRGTSRFRDEAAFGELGVLRLRHVHLGAPPWVCR